MIHNGNTHKRCYATKKRGEKRTRPERQELKRWHWLNTVHKSHRLSRGTKGSRATSSNSSCLRAARHFLRTPKGGPPRKKCLSACTFHNLTKSKNASPICHNSLLCRLSDNCITPEILRCSPHIQIFEKYIELFVCPPHPHGAEKLRGWFSAVKSFCG